MVYVHEGKTNYEERSEPKDTEQVIADYRERLADWDEADDTHRAELLDGLKEDLLNSDATDDQLAAVQYAIDETAKAQADAGYDSHAQAALQYLGLTDNQHQDNVSDETGLGSQLAIRNEATSDTVQTRENSGYQQDERDNYSDERKAISYLINETCTIERMTTLQNMMHPQREPDVDDHQNMAELAHDLKAVVAAVREDMDEKGILGNSSRQQMDYYEQMLTNVEQAHEKGEFERMRRNEAILLQGMIIHFDAGYGDGNLDDRRSKAVNEVYQEVLDTKRQANDIEIAMGYRQPDDTRFQSEDSVDDFGMNLIQKLQNQAQYLAGQGTAGGTDYDQLRERLNDACNAILDAIGNDERHMNNEKAAAFVKAIQALAENNPAYEQRMIRDLQQKLEAYQAGYRMDDDKVVNDTVIDQQAMDALHTINWPGEACDRETYLKTAQFLNNLADEIDEQKGVMENTGNLSLEKREQYDRVWNQLQATRDDQIREAEQYQEIFDQDEIYARRRGGEKKIEVWRTIQDALATLDHLPQYQEALQYVRDNASKNAQANFDQMVQDRLGSKDAASAYRPSNWLREPQDFGAIQDTMTELRELFDHDTHTGVCDHCDKAKDENMQYMAQVVAMQGTLDIDQYVRDIAEGNTDAYPLRPDTSEILSDNDIAAYNRRTAQDAQELMQDIKKAWKDMSELLMHPKADDQAPEFIQMARRFQEMEQRAQDMNRNTQFA